MFFETYTYGVYFLEDLIAYEQILLLLVRRTYPPDKWPLNLIDFFAPWLLLEECKNSLQCENKWHRLICLLRAWEHKQYLRAPSTSNIHFRRIFVIVYWQGRLRQVLTCVFLFGRTWTWGGALSVVVKGDFYSGKVLICFSCTAHFLPQGATSS